MLEEVFALEREGYARVHAATIVAQMHGLRPVESGWSVDELERLSFLRWRQARSDLEW